MDDDDTPTRPSSPNAKKSSGTWSPGLAVCPQCEGSRVAEGGTCSYCEGAGRVTLKRHHDYVGLKP